MPSMLLAPNKVEFADILFELRGVDHRVVGVGLRPVAELMAADRICGRRGEVEWTVDAQMAFRPIDPAEELAGSE